MDIGDQIAKVLENQCHFASQTLRRGLWTWQCELHRVIDAIPQGLEWHTGGPMRRHRCEHIATMKDVAHLGKPVGCPMGVDNANRPSQLRRLLEHWRKNPIVRTHETLRANLRRNRPAGRADTRINNSHMDGVLRKIIYLSGQYERGLTHVVWSERVRPVSNMHAWRNPPDDAFHYPWRAAKICGQRDITHRDRPY